MEYALKENAVVINSSSSSSLDIREGIAARDLERLSEMALFTSSGIASRLLNSVTRCISVNSVLGIRRASSGVKQTCGLAQFFENGQSLPIHDPGQAPVYGINYQNLIVTD